jgi:hypothetical protein
MSSTPNPCYLIDGQGMELHLRRQHPNRGSSPWARLSEWKPAPGEEGAELHLFGPQLNLPRLEPGAPLLECTGQPLSEWMAWIRRDARKRTAPCRYILVCVDIELRRQAREQGMVVLEPDALARRLGVSKGPVREGASSSAVALPEREPAVIKGGKAMSDKELAWWTSRMEQSQPMEQDPFGAEDAPPPPLPEKEDPALDPEHARLARLMGAKAGDPRLVRHPEEEWLASQFPEGEGERPRPQPGNKEKQRRR